MDVIIVDELHKSYKQKHAVNGVSFAVAQGEIFGIVGPNGAGKTTTLEILEGLRKRDRGNVQVLGMDPVKNKSALMERVGIQFQATSIQEKLKVREALDLFASFYKRKGKVQELVGSLGLEPFLNTSFKDLSGGWKQRLTLALSTIHDPEIVFLDEPSTGLDPQVRREIWDLIQGFKEHGKTVVITTHYMEEAEKLCDRIAMFKNGKLAALDTPKRLVTAYGAIRHLSFISSKLEISSLNELREVEKAERDGETIKVFCENLQEATLAVFQLAKERQWDIDAFRYETGTLDDLFVQMAQGVESA